VAGALSSRSHSACGVSRIYGDTAMTTIFSTISGQFSKALILGTFAPVALFIVAVIVALPPLVPAGSTVVGLLATLDMQGKVVAATLGGIVGTLALYNLNGGIIRFFEGYPWMKTWFGRRRIARYQRRFSAAEARWTGLRTLARALDKVGDDRCDMIDGRRVDVGNALTNTFPLGWDDVLPTRLGNTVRSFETYPDRQYGMEAIVLWPRLIAKIDKDYASAIDDAKMGLDFMLNCCVLSCISAALIIAVGVAYALPMASPPAFIGWLLTILALAALGRVFYGCSLTAASAWGEMVKGAFDLYRVDLLAPLGYTRAPTTKRQERTLWDNISLQMLYGADKVDASEPYYPERPAVGAPDGVEVDVSRGVSVATQDGALTITLLVRNVDRESRAATGVTVVDAVPEGFGYEWDSALIGTGGDKPPVRGANPYRFDVGELKANEEVIISYRIIPVGK